MVNLPKVETLLTSTPPWLQAVWVNNSSLALTQRHQLLLQGNEEQEHKGQSHIPHLSFKFKPKSKVSIIGSIGALPYVTQ